MTHYTNAGILYYNQHSMLQIDISILINMKQYQSSKKGSTYPKSYECLISIIYCIWFEKTF